MAKQILYGILGAIVVVVFTLMAIIAFASLDTLLH